VARRLFHRSLQVVVQLRKEFLRVQPVLIWAVAQFTPPYWRMACAALTVT
jgi:hypothetical protein